jgi:hypothetical protein
VDIRKAEREDMKRYVSGYDVWFPIDARKVGKYEFKARVYKNGLVEFPKTTCRKKWQRTEFRGL